MLNEKYILKRAAAAANLVPASVTRRSKQPYRAPEAVSFVTPNRRGHLPEYVETLLAPDRVERDGVFNPVAATKLMAKVRAGRAIGIRDNMSFVAMLSTQLFIDRFINRAA